MIGRSDHDIIIRPIVTEKSNALMEHGTYTFRVSARDVRGQWSPAESQVALRVLAPLGLVFDENSPWLNVSACTGSPGCAHAAAAVRADAARALDADSGVHRHFVGCDRACGSPLAGEVLLATGDGYRQLRGDRQRGEAGRSGSPPKP